MESQTIHGTLRPDGTLELCEKPSIPAGPVEVVIRPLEQRALTLAEWQQYYRQMRKHLEEAGYPFFKSAAEVNAYLDEVRSGDERIEEVYRQSESARSEPK